MIHNTSEERVPESSRLPSIPEMFSRYTARTDGKERIAKALLDLIPDSSRGLLVDLGAGDGKLAELLAPAFHRVLLIDKNDENRAALSRIKNGRALITRMEQAVPVPAFDVALMSYSLTGVPDQNIQEFLNKLFECRGPKGRVLFVTFQDGCDWDRFTTPIYTQIGRPRNGGSQAHLSLARSCGFSCQRLASFETELFDESVQMLAATLGFFFAPKHQAFFDDLSTHTKALAELTVPSKYGGVALRCVEEIWEIQG
jgi:SAM-dependent methyltransferase